MDIWAFIFRLQCEIEKLPIRATGMNLLIVGGVIGSSFLENFRIILRLQYVEMEIEKVANKSN